MSASAHIVATVKRQFAGESARLSLWSPVGLMIGIGWYFFLPDEPQAYAGALALALCVMLLAATWRTRFRIVIIPFLLIALGFSAAQWRAHRVTTPLLGEELHNHIVEGTIDEIEPVEEKDKLVLSHLVIEGMSPEATPLRVRVSFRGHDDSVQVGDRVRFYANLYPLPLPTMPGSYDFARHFYFRSIGGNGFAMRAAERIEGGQESGLRIWINRLRHSIGEDMRAHMDGQVGTVAAAMTVGETGPIPADVKTMLRDSGLAHMLAIAGLHLGIVTGVIFFNVRLLLTLYPPLALRLPVKKIAAAFALISAFIYLMLAGYPIPAQRAFIMVTFFFTAVLLDRRGITLRTLSIAAMMLLLLFPESLFGASFEMSFAATLAIISLYESYSHALHRPSASWGGKIFYHVLGIVATSLVATLATAPFVLYHFNRFAILGLIANMVVVPLATFVIMPGMVLALLLMPFGLQAIGYAPMAFGTDIMIAMAGWGTSLPSAALHFPSPTDMGLMIASGGLLWLCLFTKPIRLLGLVAIAAGLSTISEHVPVDVFISSDARQVMVRLSDGHYTALRGTARSFTIQNWLRSEGEDELVPVKETDTQCDAIACMFSSGGHSVILIKKTYDDVLEEACQQKVDVLIAWRYLHSDRCTGPAHLIGRAELETFGAHAVWFQKNGVRIMGTLRPEQGHRLWQPILIHEPEEEE